MLDLGLFGGFFIVPLYALIQIRSAPEQRARIIAANNILNALFIVCGALAAAGLLGEGLSIAGLFAVAALSEGELVAIFPEGRITDNGEFYPFRPGMQRIIERTPVPVIPMARQGRWGSFFSRKDSPAMSNPLRRGLFSRIGLNVGPAVPTEEATPAHLQEIVAGSRGNWN